MPFGKGSPSLICVYLGHIQGADRRYAGKQMVSTGVDCSRTRASVPLWALSCGSNTSNSKRMKRWK